MDAFIVAFRIPNLVRDLFAEGAMSAAFVPTFTRRLTLHGKDDAWRLGNNLINALCSSPALLVVARHRVRGADRDRAYAGDFSRVPGKLELTIALTRIMLPFLTMVAVAAACDGHAQLAAPLLHAGAVAGACSTSPRSSARFVLVPLMPAFGLPPITAVAIAALVGGALQVASSGRRCVARDSAIVRCSTSAIRTSSGARADGAGHDRSRGDAGQPVRQHAARDQPGDGRGVVARRTRFG